MAEELSSVLQAVRQRVEPTDAEHERLEQAAREVIDRAEAALEERGIDGDVMLVGSTARNTWIAGDRDVDVFVRFPPDTDRETLESVGLEIGHAVLPDGHEEYAEHPYVVGEVDGYDVDLVPCYDVKEATAIQSAVDRTPFHTEYLQARLDDDLADDVRLAKAFLKGIGVYGSDLRTQGFSGYLTELLVLEHGGFRPLIEAAAEWHPPVRFDPEDHGAATFDDDLVVIDPTDPERNVAAALSTANLARFQHYARELLADPRESLFEPADSDPLDPPAVRAAFDERGTTPVAMTFETPDLVDDDLYPQLEKSLDGIRGLLDQHGFDVLRAAAFADERAVLLFELEVAERPAIERHVGPPVHVREHAEGFYEKYADSDVYGPFVRDDRYVVERTREFRTAEELLESDAIYEVALGTDVESALRSAYSTLVGPAVSELTANFGTELARYLDPKP
ncbi:CCA-adding enzyme protein [Halorhabdus tiamatea SARL4B]|uniref:CCA-adding enzyme n=1 Tax=Halorhabdus tiamatea SARL4B TaxID=1033806 RepID=F7PPZ3_9EURY|nr:CCA tRNA nucleotidyltransferase [Halorhabdus tiamatea]ERJ07338.1 CCA-adding enzyme protein [Halorhabdus tiamatea SARL4B]CCQ34115.1 tRNA nucleotidyltransferase, archaeal type [Halorhabdus tiamatea SARL4B]